MRVFVTGGTGFVGHVLVQKLVQTGHEVTVLVRKKGASSIFGDSPLRLSASGGGTVPFYGDVLDFTSLKLGLKDHDAVIHLVGIIREFLKKGITFQRLHVEATENIINAAKFHSIKRYLHMSALGTSPNAQARYHQTKFQAEEIVRKSGLDYTIFRPSVIFGKEDEFVNMFAGMMRAFPIVPLVRARRASPLLQPIFVEDVAEGFVSALSLPETIGQTYDLGGPQSYTLSQILDIIAKVLDRKILKIQVPIWWMRFLATFLDQFPWFPVTREQLLMLQRDNICDPANFSKTFSIPLTPFEEGIRKYLVTSPK